MTMPNQPRKGLGILRCGVCGHEQDRVPKGLNYGFPTHCGQTMRVVTELERQEEREWADRVEDEERFNRSVHL